MRKSCIAILAALAAGCLDAGAQAPLDPDDVAAQYAELLAIPDVSAQRQAIFQTAIQWAAADPMAAYAAITAQAPGSSRDEIEYYFFSAWLMRDAASALRFIASLEQVPAGLMTVSTIRGTVSGQLPMNADSDWAEILNIARMLPADFARVVRLHAVRRMARDDPQSAAEHIRTFPAAERRRAGMNIARDFASSYPEAALDWARSLQEPSVVDAVIRVMAAADPYGMLARAVSGDAGIPVSVVAASAVGMRASDNAQFGSALAQLPEGDGRSMALAAFTQSWLVRDQDAALDWLASTSIELPAEAIMRAANRAGSDREFAAQFAQRLEGPNRSEWIERVGSDFGRADPEAALEWLEQFRSDPAYPEVLADILPRLAQTDGPRAARLIEGLEGRDRLGASWTIARRWARADPVAAARWADRLPDDARIPSIRAVIDEWYARDSTQAERWVLGLPRGALQDASLLGLVAAIVDRGRVPSAAIFDAFSTESVRERARAYLDPPSLEPGLRMGPFGPMPARGNADDSSD